MLLDVDIASFGDLWDTVRQNLPNDVGCDAVYQVHTRLGVLYATEVGRMFEYARDASQPQIRFAPFQRSGHQFIAEFWVNDLAKPARDEYNWHLQNTSQWVYAGALLFEPSGDDPRYWLSAHH